MDDKYAKRLVDEVKLIRKELQKQSNTIPSNQEVAPKEMTYDEMVEKAGDQVTIK